MRKYLIGIDEVGRGPLAGPVSIGIAVVPVDFDFTVFEKLNDSKKMTAERRELVVEKARELKKAGNISFGVFSESNARIDGIGIERCISSLIARGLKKLSYEPREVKIFLDGRLKAPQEYEQETVIHGDALVPVISLASVVAKVERDRYMTEVVHVQFPQYEFLSHKGYGTASHIRAIREHGPSPVHRQSFLSRILPSALEASTIRV